MMSPESNPSHAVQLAKWRNTWALLLGDEPIADEQRATERDDEHPPDTPDADNDGIT